MGTCSASASSDARFADAEVLRPDHAAFRVDHRTFDHVLQFPHIPFPGTLHQDVHGLVGHRDRPFPDLGAVLVQELLGKRRDIVPPLPERRNGDGEHVQPVEQVLAEQLGLDRLLDVLVRCRHDAHVDLDGTVPADPFDHLLLDHAQDLRLERQVHVADLVEEDRPLVRKLELPELPRLGAGKGAPLVPEELALQQFPGDSRGIDGDKGSVLAIAQIVNGPGEQLLARAALAVDEHGGIGGRHLLDARRDLLELSALADDLRERRACLRTPP